MIITEIIVWKLVIIIWPCWLEMVTKVRLQLGSISNCSAKICVKVAKLLVLFYYTKQRRNSEIGVRVCLLTASILYTGICKVDLVDTYPFGVGLLQLLLANNGIR